MTETHRPDRERLDAALAAVLDEVECRVASVEAALDIVEEDPGGSGSARLVRSSALHASGSLRCLQRVVSLVLLHPCLDFERPRVEKVKGRILTAAGRAGGLAGIDPNLPPRPTTPDPFCMWACALIQSCRIRKDPDYAPMPCEWQC